MNYPIRVLFVCSGNSARSQMAEGLLRWLGGADFCVESAGTRPAGVHPAAVLVMDEFGIDISHQYSKDIATFAGAEFDYVITLCDKALGSCPDFSGDEERIHWSFPDIGELQGDERMIYRAFLQVAAGLRDRIRLFVTAQRKALRDQGYLTADVQEV